ncbi:MAG TPA: acyl-CoA dehydrogenase family protein [Bryobacteraceae bacterium]|nr:acyl-CoA dehydrogenase family protein [Bryobacteraceae bacterium]
MQPLTELSAEEKLFRDTVRRFARERIAPLDKSPVREIFDLGLMGIEIPEEFGGQDGNFFQCVQAIEEISAVDPAVIYKAGSGVAGAAMEGTRQL